MNLVQDVGILILVTPVGGHWTDEMLVEDDTDKVVVIGSLGALIVRPFDKAFHVKQEKTYKSLTSSSSLREAEMLLLLL